LVRDGVLRTISMNQRNNNEMEKRVIIIGPPPSLFPMKTFYFNVIDFPQHCIQLKKLFLETIFFFLLCFILLIGQNWIDFFHHNWLSSFLSFFSIRHKSRWLCKQFFPWKISFIYFVH
jgi:hypothetical protein